ncbi:MAG: flagellar biosynthesis GTPase FlhF, partial [Planctomycetota bacterium]
MNLSDLEKKVARLVPRRLLRSALGQVVEAEVKRRDLARSEGQVKSLRTQQETPQTRSKPKTYAPQQALPKPVTGRAPRIPQAQPEQSTGSVSDLELRPAELEPGARDVRERMLQRGASAALADRIVREVVAAGARGTFAIDAAAEEMSRVFRFEKSPRGASAPHILFFVGPTGSGKTSTMAKLGRKLGAAGRNVFYATLDPLSASGLSGAVGSDIDRTELP